MRNGILFVIRHRLAKYFTPQKLTMASCEVEYLIKQGNIKVNFVLNPLIRLYRKTVFSVLVWSFIYLHQTFSNNTQC